MTRFFISAGETSGDFHAATVVTELKQRFPSAIISGIAGSQMQQQGCVAMHDINALNVMGIGDVMRSLGRIRRIEQSILSHCTEHQPDVAILVDFSSFHMRLGRKLKRLGIPVIHFIAPKLWAWGSWRVKKLIKSQDRLACILPFETEWFKQHGIAHAEYVGNPSVITCQQGWSKAELKQHIGIAEHQPLLALLPGSRPQEVKIHLPLLIEVLTQAQQQITDLVCVVPLAPGVDQNELQALWQLGAKPIERTETAYAMRADAAVAVSGTATLELALWNTPTVLIYQAAPLMAFLARRLIQVRCVGLANIILGDKAVMPELVQENCRIDNILTELLPLLRGTEAADQQRRECATLRDILGHKKPAMGVVDMVESLMR
ncbi:MAG: lipid-A-disaccharide synthase [Mariprofundus sp.]|nr:lipid-A-disaccharide synthase [Mariprofundus sp.]